MIMTSLYVNLTLPKILGILNFLYKNIEKITKMIYFLYVRENKRKTLLKIIEIILSLNSKFISFNIIIFISFNIIFLYLK